MTPTDTLLAWGREMLRNAGVPGAERDARRLLEATDIGAAPGATDQQRDAYEAAITRRTRREPVSHILGRRAFWMHDFYVNGDVLDPRPETEVLISAAIGQGQFPVPFHRVLDLGTGSGCILLSLLHEVPEATGLGVDLSAAALSVAARNAEMIGVETRARLCQSDWFTAVEGQFDLIVSNPPYIAQSEMADLAPELRDWEPHLALTPGGDGLDAYRIITGEARDYLCPGGTLMVEIGSTQRAAVESLFAEAGFTRIQCFSDLDGRDRVISGENPRSA